MKDNLSLKNIKRRAKAPVNTFWKKVQLYAGGIALLTGSLLAAPMVLPAAVTTGLYIVTAMASTAVSMATLTTGDKKEADPNGEPK